MAVYGMYLFSVHMLGHMLLSMAVPVLLVLGGPVTLAARAIGNRNDGSWGPREWILHTVHSRYVETIGHPLIAAPLFALSLIVFYYSPIFEWALEDHLGHHWMVFHFLASGYIFAQMLIGVDPQPHRPVYPLRLIVVFATMAFHAFFGLSLILGTGLLAPEWFGAMGREWGDDPLTDQQTGGEIAWSLGEIPTLALAILIAIGWSREGDRESKRLDRQADRDGDQALRDYNEMLRQRGEADRKVSRQ
jgi:putative copper resistance protein D